MVLSPKFDVADINPYGTGHWGDEDDHSVANFLESFQHCDSIYEAMPSVDEGFWTDYDYIKIFDSSDKELSMSTKLVEGKSYKGIAYRKQNQGEQQEIILFSVLFYLFI